MVRSSSPKYIPKQLASTTFSVCEKDPRSEASLAKSAATCSRHSIKLKKRRYRRATKTVSAEARNGRFVSLTQSKLQCGY